MAFNLTKLRVLSNQRKLVKYTLTSRSLVAGVWHQQIQSSVQKEANHANR